MGVIILFLGTCITPSVAINTVKKSLPISNGYIQDLIDNASDGDTIYIPRGTYYENIVINKSINLVGENKDTTVIDGNRKGDVVFISADWVNISNFTIQKSKRERPYSGVRVVSDHNSISGNNILENYIGIRFESSSRYNIISCNNITSCDTDGIELEKSNYSTITRNIIINNVWHGIEMDWSNYNYITNNDIISNDNGIFISHSCNYNLIKRNYIVSNLFGGIKLLWDSNNNIVNSNNISLSGNDGIKINDAKYNTITNNNITLNDLEGINIEFSSNNNIITKNNISSNGKDGIYVYKSTNNTIFNNNISNNRHGVYLTESKRQIIINNSFFNDGLYCRKSYYNTVENNSVNCKPLVYLEDESNKTITYAGQVILIKCINITLINLEISYTDIGILLRETNNCTVRNNTIFENYGPGIYLYECNYNTILDNNVISNKIDGIYLAYSNNNIISGNIIKLNSENDFYKWISSGINLHWKNSNNMISSNNIISNKNYGIRIVGGNNTIYHNNFINNGENAFEKHCYNVWDDGVYGNYWSDYKNRYPSARKIWSKGIWDTPYDIKDEDNKDNFPLIWQWPKSRTRTITRTQTTIHPIIQWFLERFPILEKLLTIGYFYSRLI